MLKRINNQKNMMKGLSRFILESTITPPIARVTALKAEIDTVIDAIDAASATQVSGRGEKKGGVGTRRDRAKALRDYLKDVARVGRSLGRTTHPGLAEVFVLPKSQGYPALLDTTAVMIERATPLEAEFVARGLKATFLADIAALVTAFNAGTDGKVDGLLTQVGGTSAMRHLAQRGMDAADELDAIIRAHFRDDPVKLDVWTHARHVQVAPESDPEEPETPPESGGGSGSLAAIGSGTAGEGGSAV